MITVKIGTGERSLEAADESWIDERISTSLQPLKIKI